MTFKKEKFGVFALCLHVLLSSGEIIDDGYCASGGPIVKNSRCKENDDAGKIRYDIVLQLMRYLTDTKKLVILKRIKKTKFIFQH